MNRIAEFRWIQRLRRFPINGSIGLSIVLCALPLGAQNLERRLEVPTCRDCALTIVPVGALGGHKGALRDEGDIIFLRATDAGTLFALTMSSASVFEISTNGQLIRTIGRSGEGPGEFRRPMIVLETAADSIVVYDGQLGRLSVFARKGKYARSQRVLPGLSDISLLPDQHVLAAGRAQSRPGTGVYRGSIFPLHLLAGDSVVRSFGETMRRIDPRNPFQFDRFLVTWANRVVSVQRANRFSVEIWDPRMGKLDARLVREPTWFLPYESLALAEPSRPPSPTITGAWLGGDGMLWVAGNRARPQWKQAYGKPRASREGGPAFPRIEKMDLLVEGFVEVFDLQARTLRYSGALPFPVMFVLGRGMVGSAHNDAEGVATVSLHSLTLRTR